MRIKVDSVDHLLIAFHVHLVVTKSDNVPEIKQSVANRTKVEHMQREYLPVCP